jgi:hypothetical protein
MCNCVRSCLHSPGRPILKSNAPTVEVLTTAGSREVFLDRSLFTLASISVCHSAKDHSPVRRCKCQVAIVMYVAIYNFHGEWHEHNVDHSSD